jgi:dipeptidyl aminopeptidase/acylaminoacyl peptidase
MLRARARSVIIALVLLRAAHASGATVLDPALRFQVLATAHFTIYFHQGEEAQARRLAGIAENVWMRLPVQLGLTAPPHTHVLLVDQTDLANGWATPLPYDTILVTAAAPAGVDQIGRVEDWLELVFIHEFTHIVHLDRSAGWARPVRAVFGRLPIAFPNLFLPVWQIEGIAAWQESVVTGEGRLHAGDFRAIEREAARARAVEPLDRINGGLTDWPSGSAPYAYGLGFHQYLADRFGSPSLGRLAGETSRALPYFGSLAFSRVYGHSLGELWRDYVRTLEDTYRPIAAGSEPKRLTHDGFGVSGPRFARPCRGCDVEIVYSVQNPDGFPELRAVGRDGTHERALAKRFLGSTVGVGEARLVFDQQELRRNVALASDLYFYDWSTKRVRALTRDERLRDPDLSPDGRTIACVRETRGRRDLVAVRLTGSDSAARVADIVTLASDAETHFDAPRFSPDGRRVAAARQRLGALSEIVVVDAATGAIQTVASNRAARIVTPTWTPDGRNIIAAADYDESPFNLFEYPLDGGPPRRLTATTGGATWPDVSPDGRTIVFTGYTTAGDDLFTIPFADSAAAASRTTTDVASGVSGTMADVASAFSQTTRAYSPFPTLPPTFWTPVFEPGSDQWRLGAAISGADVLARHAYAASATWLLDAPAGADASHSIPDWQISYAYDRWRPTFFASASRDTSFAAGPADITGRPTNATLVEQAIEGGVILPFRRVRHRHAALIDFRRVLDTYKIPIKVDGVEQAEDTANAARLGWTSNTAQQYGYSISPEDGVTVGGTAEFLHSDAASDLVRTVTADARAYLPGVGARHVVALRGGVGISDGDPIAARFFHLGGAAANPNVVSFDRNALSLLRGFPADAFAGTRLALINADYRWPIARPQRGAGTFPLFLNTLHAAVFADAGHAWTGDFDMHRAKIAAGAELGANVVAGYQFPFSITVGAAWGRDGAHVVDGGTVYLRLGRAF